MEPYTRQYRFNEIKEKVKDGDKILTRVNSHPAERVVTVKGDGVILKEHYFHWDFFFEVNTPIEIQLTEE